MFLLGAYVVVCAKLCKLCLACKTDFCKQLTSKASNNDISYSSGCLTPMHFRGIYYQQESSTTPYCSQQTSKYFTLSSHCCRLQGVSSQGQVASLCLRCRRMVVPDSTGLHCSSVQECTQKETLPCTGISDLYAAI